MISISKIQPLVFSMIERWERLSDYIRYIKLSGLLYILIIPITVINVCEGQQPSRFQFSREQRRIGGQIFAVSSLLEACTVGSGLIKAAGVNGKSQKEIERSRVDKSTGSNRERERRKRARERTGEHSAFVSHATQEVVAPVVDSYEHETRVSTYESPGGTFPYRADPRRASGRGGISFRMLFRLKSCLPLALRDSSSSSCARVNPS